MNHSAPAKTRNPEPSADPLAISEAAGRGPNAEALDRAIDRSRRFLLSQQDEDGFWVDELEANATITAELVFLMHFTDRVDLEKQKKCVRYLLHQQRADGSWALFHGGAGNVSTTVEAYMALKIAGKPPDRPEMARAREFILASGGIKKTRVFTKIFLAMFGQISWKWLPAMPVEFTLLPNWFFINIYEMSSWSRGVIVPLLVVYAHQPVHRLEDDRGVRELFTENDRDLSIPYSGTGLSWRNFFVFLDGVIKFLGKSPWKPLRRRALKKAEQWVLDHQEEQGDWAGIQPAMFNAVLALHYLGYPKDHPALVKGFEAIDRFIIDKGDHLVMQSCISPLWDTAIACNALMDAGLPADHPALVKSGQWMFSKQVVKPGDWKIKNPHTEPGGWAFEFFNECYPDTDDTAEILMALHRIENRDTRFKLREFQRALTWLLSMQSKNGGWGAFDQDNDLELLNKIPFADHGAMLDPPTADVTGRILWLLGILGYKKEHPQVRRAIAFVKRNQEADGSWYGRWGVNYVYGTFLALTGLRSIGEAMDQAFVRKAVDWLEAHQNEDGGWGETCDTYEDPSLRGAGASTASQTAWAVMGLLTAGQANGEPARRGVEYLIARQNEAGTWWEDQFTGTGFPVHFFIKYHMYQHYFPLMALARYRAAIRDGAVEPRKKPHDEKKSV
ncbi:MAG: squalene--hopene cyclase [Nitrospinales bacterium]